MAWKVFESVWLVNILIVFVSLPLNLLSRESFPLEKNTSTWLHRARTYARNQEIENEGKYIQCEQKNAIICNNNKYARIMPVMSWAQSYTSIVIMRMKNTLKNENMSQNYSPFEPLPINVRVKFTHRNIQWNIVFFFSILWKHTVTFRFSKFISVPSKKSY